MHNQSHVEKLNRLDLEIFVIVLLIFVIIVINDLILTILRNENDSLLKEM